MRKLRVDYTASPEDFNAKEFGALVSVVGSALGRGLVTEWVQEVAVSPFLGLSARRYHPRGEAVLAQSRWARCGRHLGERRRAPGAALGQPRGAGHHLLQYVLPRRLADRPAALPGVRARSHGAYAPRAEWSQTHRTDSPPGIFKTSKKLEKLNVAFLLPCRRSHKRAEVSENFRAREVLDVSYPRKV